MTGDLRFDPIHEPQYEAVRAFLSEMGWASRVSDPMRFRAMMERADRTIVASCDGRMVGFGRALCDGVSNGYISMLAVHPDFQRRGIGTEIVMRLTGDDPRITWVLRAGRESGGVLEETRLRRLRHRHGARALRVLTGPCQLRK